MAFQEPKTKNFFGFKTGDMVKAVIPIGARTKILPGIYVGKITVRANGQFDIKIEDTKVGTPYKYCKLIHSMDGYSYE